ncbi:hypothetical protein TNCT_648481 [Trichonephila clavata]|uniref:Uncharacterized protein n=1 Tax=Trichonephila clavata TaxID=2740835 RepID=A0A8X6HA61_TRICU|nr:hypothetical protein TNCT_648481 [Trichonephila clavata]
MRTSYVHLVVQRSAEQIATLRSISTSTRVTRRQTFNYSRVYLIGNEDTLFTKRHSSDLFDCSSSLPIKLNDATKKIDAHQKRKQKRKILPILFYYSFLYFIRGESYVVPESLSGRERDDENERGLIDALSSIVQKAPWLSESISSSILPASECACTEP